MNNSDDEIPTSENAADKTNNSESKISDSDGTSDKNGTLIFEVWDKYESIAMHFNDLLIKLRVQALGGVAAIASIVAVLSKDSGFNWAVLSVVFSFLALFWVAIWILDFFYYNRLLIGAVDALLEVEKLSKTQSFIKELNLSTEVERAVRGENKVGERQKWEHLNLTKGRKLFYTLVFIGLLAAFIFSFCKYLGMKN